MNTLLFKLIIFQTLNCKARNNLCFCLNCSIFVLQSKLTEFSAILKQQQNDNMVFSGFPPKNRPGMRAIEYSENKFIIHFENEAGPGVLESTVQQTCTLQKNSHRKDRINT